MRLRLAVGLGWALALSAFAPAAALPPTIPGESQRPAAAALPGPLGQVGFDQRLGDALPLDTAFRDETGRAVALRDYFRGKPVVLTLAYYTCPMLCTLVQNGLTGSLKALQLEPGRDFEVVVVSFDPRDTPERAAAKKAEAVSRYGRPETAAGWHYLTGSQESIRALTSAVGFRYAFDEKTQEFAHATGLVVVTPDGRLGRYLYGIEFSPRDLRLALVEASDGKIGGFADQVLLLCFHYDASLGKYSAATLKILRVSAVITLAVLVTAIGGAVRRDRRTRRALAGRPV